jgi:hypothetical protein
MMWVAAVQSGETLGEEFSAPAPGACSLPNALVEADGSRPPPLDAILAEILKFEFAANLGDRLFNRHEVKLRNTPYGLIRFGFCQLRMRHRLRYLELDDFVTVVVDRAIAAALSAKYYKNGDLEARQPIPDGAPIPAVEELPTEILLAGMVDGLVAMAARAKVDSAILEQWRNTANETGVLNHLGSWLDFVENLFVGDQSNASEEVRDPSLQWWSQLTASVRVSIDDATRPNELLAMHHFWIGTLHKLGKSLLVLSDLELLVAKSWQIQSERTFLLRSPALSAPALRSACASNAQGWRKIGEILCAACDAVPGNVPAAVRELFQSLVREA